MDIIWIATAMIGSLGAAFLLQRFLLSAVLQAIDPNRGPKN